MLSPAALIERWRDMPPRKFTSYSVEFVLFALSLLGARWLKAHWEDPDVASTAIGFLVAWIPFGISLWIASMVDLQGKSRLIKWGIVVGGLFWSILAWEDKRRTLQSDRDQQEQLMAKFEEANIHTDKQVGIVRDDLKQDRAHGDEQIGIVRDELKSAVKEFSDLVAKTEGNLTSSIGKVGKPDPPEVSRLQFSFFTVDRERFPILSQTISPTPQRTYIIDFTVRNISNVAAREGELWIQICTACTYVKEPVGFQKLAGSEEQQRHFTFDRLNAGVVLERKSAEISVNVKGFTSFDTSFQYSCTNCAPPIWQTLKSFVAPAP